MRRFSSWSASLLWATALPLGLALGLALGCGSPPHPPPAAGAPNPASQPAPAAAPQPGALVVAAPSEPEDAGAASATQDRGEPSVDPQELRRAELAAVDQLPRHRPLALSEAPRRSRLAPGVYQCSVGDGYKLRDCRVEKDAEGRTLLDIGEGNLIAAKGVIWDDGPKLRFEGWLTDARPFGCFSCQDRCYIDPGSCGCQPGPLEVARECVVQPVHAELSGGGGQFRGDLSLQKMWGTYEGVGGERRLTVAKRPESFSMRLIAPQRRPAPR